MIFFTMMRTLISLLIAAGIALPSLADAAEPKAANAVKRGGPVATGQIAPDFTLEDQNGRSHSLSAERGKRPVILVFYRGYW